MERYTEEQEDKIHDEYYDRVTAWFKSQGLRPLENFTPERQIVAAAIFEECMEQVNQSDQDISGDGSGTTST
jgi:hypothetical protein